VFAVSEVRINAEPRTEFGKGGARRTRRAGKVPAVLYGHGQAPVHIALPAREFAAIIRHSGMTQVLNIDISDGTKALALPKAIQRDPVRDTYDHVDLLVVRAGEKITIDVPVVLVGEAARDTLVNHEHQSISIIADATKLPEHIEASIAGLEAGSHVTAGQLTLPAGVELAADPELIVVIVNNAPTAEDLDAEPGEVEGGAEEEAEEAAAEEATEEAA
jgi:large subunit ribosomal protein L25